VGAGDSHSLGGETGRILHSSIIHK
jgi:hypothetical protein